MPTAVIQAWRRSISPAVRAAAEICRAEVEGDSLGSARIDFRPAGRVLAGRYLFDLAAAREGGSAGSVTLVLQTVLQLGLADVGVERQPDGTALVRVAPRGSAR